MNPHRKVTEPHRLYRVGLNLGYTEASFYRTGSQYGDGAEELCLEVKTDEADEAQQVYLSVPDAASLVLLLLSDHEVSDAYEEHRAKAALSPLAQQPASTGEP